MTRHNQISHGRNLDLLSAGWQRQIFAQLGDAGAVTLLYRHRRQHLLAEIDDRANVMLPWQSTHRVNHVPGATRYVAAAYQAEGPLQFNLRRAARIRRGLERDCPALRLVGALDIPRVGKDETLGEMQAHIRPAEKGVVVASRVGGQVCGSFPRLL